jgi:hypothetical protein
MSKRKTPNMRKLEQARVEEVREKTARKVKQGKDEIGHVRPTLATYRYEKNLKKIATRGVVALFNAVAEAQRLQEEVVSKSSAIGTLKNANGESMDKSEFLDMLSKQAGGKGGKGKAEAAAAMAAAAASSSSSSSGAASGKAADAAPAYLRDDFMKGASIKHWDQEDSEADDDEDEEGQGEDSGSSDSDSDS